MSSSPAETDEGLDLVCQSDCVQGMVDALSSVRWKRNQDALVELSEHGIVLIVEEANCLQAKVYLKRELFLTYEYNAEGRPRFGLSLGLFIDCLNTFSSPGKSPLIEIGYPGPDMQLILKSVDSSDVCTYAEIRTRIADTISWDRNFGPSRDNRQSFTIRTSALKEAIDDLEWPSSTVQILLQPEPPCVVLKGEGHGDLQIEFPHYVNSCLLMAFQCDHQFSYRYKYKFLRASVSSMAASVLRDDNRGSKLTFGRGRMLKIQHLVTVGKPGIHHPRSDFSGPQQPSAGIAYIEFYIRAEEDE
ncbi:PCNA domain-containing protein [Wolffia australiana]